jgi:energy-coupling factor transporter ATP-binding protein EcfA2
VKSETELAAGDAVGTDGEGAPMVEVEDVSFTYHGADHAALRSIQFTQRKAEMVGVLGASGAGKSTLAKCLNYIVPGLEEGDFRGVVRIGRRTLGGGRVCEMAPMVGMVFQDFEAQLFSTNVAHEVAFAMEQVGMERHEMVARMTPALEAVGLEGFERRDPTSLSGGEKQRLAIAAVLALRPSLIVLDEPTTDLDPEGKAEVFALIRKLRDEGLSLIVIEHDSEELRQCDRLVVVRDGRIAAEGPPAEILARIDLLEESGIRPPELVRLLQRLGIPGFPRTVVEAESLIRDRLASHTSSESRVAVKLEPPHGAAAQSDEAPLVELDRVGFSYAEGIPALRDVSIRIAAGEFLAIIGQNGSGKTTLAKHIVGLLRPSAGQVRLRGRDRTAIPPAESAREVGYVFQNPDHQIFAATVEDEVAFGPRNFGMPPGEVERRCADVLQAVGLLDARKSDPFLLGKGERQRLAVASVLALRPKLLILDEPTTGLDYREQRRMMALVSDLSRAGTAIVIITHTPWLVAEYAPRVVLMGKGRILFDGQTRAFFENDELLARSSFRLPEVTELGRRFGVTALTVDELARWLEAPG